MNEFIKNGFIVLRTDSLPCKKTSLQLNTLYGNECISM